MGARGTGAQPGLWASALEISQSLTDERRVLPLVLPSSRKEGVIP